MYCCPPPPGGAAGGRATCGTAKTSSSCCCVIVGAAGGSWSWFLKFTIASPLSKVKPTLAGCSLLLAPPPPVRPHRLLNILPFQIQLLMSAESMLSVLGLMQATLVEPAALSLACASLACASSPPGSSWCSLPAALLLAGMSSPFGPSSGSPPCLLALLLSCSP